MNKADIQLLFEYDAWAWQRVLAQAARLTPEQYVAPAPTPQGSLRGTPSGRGCCAGKGSRPRRCCARRTYRLTRRWPQPGNRCGQDWMRSSPA
ncbi:MAG: hypothetical protein MUC34_11630 [Anaerolineae bacterium]|nr:hypothetical protein [Anaerolineae bacterium]